MHEASEPTCVCLVDDILNSADAMHAPRPFDFLLNGELVRGTLAKGLERHGLSGEAVALLEYVECVPPPRSP